MRKRLAFILTMFAVVIGSLCQAAAASAASGARAPTPAQNQASHRSASGLIRPTRNLADPAPTITSADHTTFTVGAAGTFTIKSTGVPPATLSETGLMPSGVVFTDNKNGTAELSGTPEGTGGDYGFVITATNGLSPDAVQDFTLTLNQAPMITSAPGATFTSGRIRTFTIESTGNPAPALSETGKLPSEVTFKDNGNGTATLSRRSAANTGGTFKFTIKAANGVGVDDTQSFTLTVPWQVLSAPTNVTAKAYGPGTAPARVDLAWTEHAPVTRFIVQRATNAAFTLGFRSVTVGAEDRTVMLGGLLRSHRYYVRIKAVNGPVTSGWKTVKVSTP
jgi:hypothetical protein